MGRTLAIQITLLCAVAISQTTQTTKSQSTAKPKPAPQKQIATASAPLDKHALQPEVDKPTGLSPDQVNVLQMPAPVFKVGDAEKKHFIVQYTTDYTRVPYKPEVAIQPVPKSADTYKTPEETFITQFSAMMSGDYDRWIAGWTEESKTLMAKYDEERKRTSADRIAMWKGALTDRQVVLVERIETGPYVLLEYSLRNAPTAGQNKGQEILHTMIPLKRVGNQWLQTQDLAEDLMFQHYTEEPEGYVRKVR